MITTAKAINGDKARDPLSSPAQLVWAPSERGSNLHAHGGQTKNMILSLKMLDTLAQSLNLNFV